MQRQTQLIEARLRRGGAVTDYRVAVAALQFLSGTLLDTYKIPCVRGATNSVRPSVTSWTQPRRDPLQPQ